MVRSAVVEEFLHLVTIDSVSGEEQVLAHYLRGVLEGLDIMSWEDRAMPAGGVGPGNILAYLPGMIESPTVLFCAHMDTVVPGKGIIPVVRDGVIFSSGETILGADDKAGIAAILELLRRLRSEPFPHVPIKVLFSVREEQGLEGVKQLDMDSINADLGYVLDHAGEIGTMVLKGPRQNLISASIIGRAAHAGVNPEKGINAIQVAAQAITAMRLGRIDEETTANIGVIHGGEARNIVPERVTLKGEARSLNPDKLIVQTEHMLHCLNAAAEKAGASVDLEAELLYPEINLDPAERVVQVAKTAIEKMGITAVYDQTGGGSDANILNQKGLPTLNLGIAMHDVHTCQEHIYIRDLENLAELLHTIVRVLSGSEE